MVKESHDRVKSRAERTLLILGSEKCFDTSISEQRNKLEKLYRPQLLRAAEANKDLDANWLGVDMKKIDPMHEIMKKVTEDEVEESEKVVQEEPIGLSLSDISSKDKAEAEEATSLGGEEKSILMAALLGAQKQSVEEVEETPQVDVDELPLDPTIPPNSKFLLLLQRMSDKVGREVPINDLLTKAEEAGMTKEEFDAAAEELEKQGIIYQSKKGTVSYADFKLS
jgi:hypothetical protein